MRGSNSEYIVLRKYFNISLEDARGYNPDLLNSEVCKPGTRGSIEEDFHLLRDNWFPYLNHFWTAWGDHRPPWRARHAVDYAPEVFDEAVTHFADGLEEEAFFDFGRVTHLVEDMGSVPHAVGDLHPDVWDMASYANFNGFENYCTAVWEDLGKSTRVREMTSLREAMESLGRETYRTIRIPGRLNADEAQPVAGDLQRLFPGVVYVRLVSTDPDLVLQEFWWAAGAGYNFSGTTPTTPDRQAVDLRDFTLRNNDWYRLPNPAGEDGEYYYIESRQDSVVPFQVCDAAGNYVPNPGNLTLAQLWAGVDGYRLTPGQEQALIPRSIEYAAGFMKYLWDFANPPPHLAGVRIEQDQNGDGMIDGGTGEVICQHAWRTTTDPGTGLRDLRELVKKPESHAMRMPTRFVLEFSEPVRNVTVALGQGQPSLTIASDLATSPGTPTDVHPYGVPLLVLDNVDLSSLPDGTVTLFVTADDLSSHLAPATTSIDPDPSTRAGRLPDGSWRHIESGGAYPATDRTQSFELGGIQARAVPPTLGCYPPGLVEHRIEIRNLSLPAATVATLAAEGTGPGWTSNVTSLNGRTLSLPAPGPAWVDTGSRFTAACLPSALFPLLASVRGEAATSRTETYIFDTLSRVPINDHPDDTQSVADPRFPTPWLLDTAAPVGILLNGWGAGIGHLLGRYGIVAAPVGPDLTVLNGGGSDISTLEVLIVGSGGLTGLDRLASFREGLARFVSGGGVLVAFTPQHGSELAALPGGAVAGYGWSEDQACFGAAARVAGRDAALSGQTRVHLDVGADGYLSRWPDEASVLLERTSNGQPAMIRYPYGEGAVYVLTLYPDWGYGAAQTSGEEWALVRDLVTAALAHPTPVEEHAAGEVFDLELPLRNGGWSSAATASLEPLTPDRQPLPAIVVPAALAPGEHTVASLTLTAPSAPGIYPVGHRLLTADGGTAQRTEAAAFFAVSGLGPQPAPTAPAFQLWLTVPNDRVPAGGLTATTVHVRNNTEADYTGTILMTWVHFGYGPLRSFTDAHIPAKTTRSFAIDYPVFTMYPFTLFAGLYDRAEAPRNPWEYVSTARAYAGKGLEPFVPSALVTLETPTSVVLPGVALPVTVHLENTSAGPLDAEVSLRLQSPDNLEIWSETRHAAVPAASSTDLAVEILAGDFETGPAFLEADVRQSGRTVGRTSRLLLHPALRLALAPSLPARWDPGAATPISFTVRNEGRVASEAGEFSAALMDAAGNALWSAIAPLPPLALAETTTITLVSSLPPLSLGTYRLQYAATVPRNRFGGAIELHNQAIVAIAASASTVVGGQTLAGTVTLVNPGDFVVSGTLGITGAGLVADGSETLVLAPGSRATREFSGTVGEGVVPGTYTLAAGFSGAAFDARETTAVVVPPARLTFHPPGTEARAGESIAIAAANTGLNTGSFDCLVRLLSVEADPADPQADELSSVRQAVRLAPGATIDVGLAIPPDLADGAYALALSGRDLISGQTVDDRAYLLVRGLSATLSLQTDRPVYARADPVTAAAGVVNGPAHLSGATLALTVAGAGAIAPVVYEGTVFVSPAGNDDTGDGSSEHPFATPQRGIDAAPAGSRVLLRAGTYTGAVSLREGTILQGEAVSGAPAAVLAASDLVGASGTTVDHLTIQDGSIVYPLAVADVRVTDCVLAGGTRSLSPRGQGIVFSGAVSRVVLGRNRLSGFRAAFAGIHFMSRSSQVLVLDNTLGGFTGSRCSGLSFWDVSDDVVVQGNLISSISGDSNGIHFWGYSAPSSELRVVNNRIQGLPGDCNGLHFWCEAQAVEVRGNRLSEIDGSGGGIHFWERVVSALVADNQLRSLRGDSSGLQLWETSGSPHLDVRLENNLLVDLAPSDAWSDGNGLIVWEKSERLTIARNRLERVADAVPDQLRSGLIVGAAATSLAIERNIVSGSPVGIALRLPDPSPYRVPPPPLRDVVISNNLTIDNRVGFHEENLRPSDAVELRDDILAGAARAGLLATGTSSPLGFALVRNSVFHANAATAEGRADPIGLEGNLLADPRFADATAGDFRLHPDSPCSGTGITPGSDIGPHDESLAQLIGPRPVSAAAAATIFWSQSLPLELEAAGDQVLHVPVAPLAAAGPLLLHGEITSARGQVLAEETVAFTVQADPVLLTLSTPLEAYRPGEAIPLALEVLNTGQAAAGDLLLRVTQEEVEIFTATVTLAPGAGEIRRFETRAAGDTVLHASAGLAVADLPLVVAAPDVRVELSGPDVVDGRPFALEALVDNRGRSPVAVRLDLAGAADDFSLRPGETRTFGREASIAGDTLFAAEVTGEAEATARKLVRYGPRPTLSLDVPPIQHAGATRATVQLGNDGSLGTALSLDLQLLAADTLVTRWGREIWLSPGAVSRETLDLGSLEVGSYTLRAFGGGLEAAAEFRVADARGAHIEAFRVGATLDAQGRLPLTVSIASDGAETQVLQISLSTDAAASLDAEFSLAPAEVRSIPFTLPVAGVPPGDYAARVDLSAGGQPVDAASATIALRPSLSLEPPAGALVLDAGVATEVAVGIANAGLLSSTARVRLSCGELFDETRDLAVAAGGRETAVFSVLLPEDTPGDLPVLARLTLTDPGGGTTQTRELTFQVRQGLDLFARGGLDRPAYFDGETASFTLRVANRLPSAVSLRGVIGYGASRSWSDFTLTPGPELTGLDLESAGGEVRLSPQASNGHIVSAALDLGETAGTLISWDAVTPEGCTVGLEVRTGPAAAPDASWSPWEAVLAGQPIPDPSGRFLQYRATLTSPVPGLAPALREVRISPADRSREIVHTSSDDFLLTPLELTAEYTVDFVAADRVFFGVHAPSGRSLLLDSIMLRRRTPRLGAWTDLPRYSAGGTVNLVVEAGAAGLLQVDTPWGTVMRDLTGPVTEEIPLALPAEIVSGTYVIDLHLLEEHVALAVEVDGYQVRVLEASLSFPAYLPGESATATVVLYSDREVGTVTIDGLVESGQEAHAAFTLAEELGAGVSRHAIAFPTDALAGGTATLIVSIHRALEGDPRALLLAGAQVWFKVLAPNHRPVAAAGPDLAAAERSWVTLDGGSSFDPDGDSLLWRWRQTAGPDALLHGPTGPHPVFLAPEVPGEGAEVDFSLEVSDGRAWSASDIVRIFLFDVNRPPVANAGIDASTPVGGHATLDGSGSHDPDGELLSFRWQIARRPPGSLAALDVEDQPTSGLRPDLPGDYEVSLLVSDGSAESAPDSVVVSTINSRPVADAGGDCVAHPGDAVQLNGSGSDDADGDQLSYAWRLVERPPGSVAELEDERSQRTLLTIDICGRYLVELRVHDGLLESAADQVAVDCTNVTPLADAGADRAARLGERVVLDGSGSTDADGDPLGYQWSFASVPAGSAATVYDPQVRDAWFVADRIGTYTLTLVVEDGVESSEPDGVAVAVGTSVAQASILIKPSAFRLSAPPAELRVRIELPDGFSAREIDANAAAITAVGRKTLARPVRRSPGRPVTVADADRDGRPELSISFPLKPLLRHLRAGSRAVLTLKGPLKTWGRFVGAGALRVR